MITLDSSGVRPSSASKISYEAWRHLPEHELEKLKTGAVCRIYCKSEDVQLWGDATYFYRPEEKPPVYRVEEKRTAYRSKESEMTAAACITAVAAVMAAASSACIWVVVFLIPDTSILPVSHDPVSTDVISIMMDANMNMLARTAHWILRIIVPILVLGSMMRLWLKGWFD